MVAPREGAVITGEERFMHKRRACAAAIAFAAIAFVPAASAGAHSAACDDTALTKAPAAERFEDWGSSSCRNASVATTVDETAAPAAASAASGERKGTFKQVGHEPLLDRGMNAALAVQGDYAYIGSRTDGGHEGMPHGGIMVVDISKPQRPELLGPPLDAKAGESTRELRVWRSQDILIVLNTNCGVGDELHHCTQPSISNLRFYDISGRHARRPQQLVQFNRDTHEFFLWEDPRDPERALIFAGNASSTCATRGGSLSCPFAVWDISPVLEGKEPVTLYSGVYPYTRFPPAPAPVQKPTGGLHS